MMTGLLMKAYTELWNSKLLQQYITQNRSTRSKTTSKYYTLHMRRIYIIYITPMLCYEKLPSLPSLPCLAVITATTSSTRNPVYKLASGQSRKSWNGTIAQAVICGRWSQDIVPQCGALRARRRKLPNLAEMSNIMLCYGGEIAFSFSCRCWFDNLNLYTYVYSYSRAEYILYIHMSDT